MDTEENDFDSFAFQQWDIQLPPLVLSRVSSAASSRPCKKRPTSAMRKALIRKATLKELILDYQRNIPKYFERGEENAVFGHVVHLGVRPKSAISRPREKPSFNPFAAPPIIKIERKQVWTPPPTFKLEPRHPNKIPKQKKTHQKEDNTKLLIKEESYNPFAPPPTLDANPFAPPSQVNSFIPSTPATPSFVSETKSRRKLSKSERPKAERKKHSKPSKHETPATKTSRKATGVGINPPINNIFALIQKLIRENLKNNLNPEQIERLSKASKVFAKFDNEVDLLANAPKLLTLIDFNDFKIPPSINVNDLESESFLSFIDNLPELKRKVEATIAIQEEQKSDEESDDAMSDSEAPIIPASYRRLSSSVIVPYQQLVASRRVPATNPHIVEEEELDEDPLKFMTDFDTLLHRQQAIEQKAFGMANDLDHDISNSEIARFQLEDLLGIIWNLFVHLKVMYEEVLPESISKAVLEIFGSSSGKGRSEIVEELQKIMKTLPREVYLYTKNFSGHLLRIVTGCSEGIGGPRRLIISLSNLFGTLFFRAIMPKSSDTYIPESLRLRQINLNSSESLNSLVTSTESLNPKADSSAILDSAIEHKADSKPDISRSRRSSASRSRKGSVSKSRIGSTASSRRGSTASSRRGSIIDVELSIVSEKSISYFNDDVFQNGDEEFQNLGVPVDSSEKRRNSKLTFIEPDEILNKKEHESDPQTGNSLQKGGSFGPHVVDIGSNIVPSSSNLPRTMSGKDKHIPRGVSFKSGPFDTPSEKRSSKIKRTESGTGGGLVRGLSFGQRASFGGDASDARRLENESPSILNRGAISDSDAFPFIEIEITAPKKELRRESHAENSFKKAILSNYTSFKKIAGQPTTFKSERLKKGQGQKSFKNSPKENSGGGLTVPNPFQDTQPIQVEKSKHKQKKKEITVKQKELGKLFNWDEVERNNIQEYILNQEFVLTPFGLAVEYFIMHWEKIFGGNGEIIE